MITAVTIRGFDVPQQCVLLDTSLIGVRIVEHKPFGGLLVQGNNRGIYLDGEIIKDSLPPVPAGAASPHQMVQP